MCQKAKWKRRWQEAEVALTWFLGILLRFANFSTFERLFSRSRPSHFPLLRCVSHVVLSSHHVYANLNITCSSLVRILRVWTMQTKKQQNNINSKQVFVECITIFVLICNSFRLVHLHLLIKTQKIKRWLFPQLNYWGKYMQRQIDRHGERRAY